MYAVHTDCVYTPHPHTINKSIPGTRYLISGLSLDCRRHRYGLWVSWSVGHFFFFPSLFVNCFVLPVYLIGFTVVLFPNPRNCNRHNKIVHRLVLFLVY